MIPVLKRPKNRKCCLVVMFLPLVGNWTQVLGAFGSYENVKGDLLDKIMIEATVLAEKSGLFVDYITRDAAACNRKMWRIFKTKASSKQVVYQKKPI